jgi:hypothetical protein
MSIFARAVILAGVGLAIFAVILYRDDRAGRRERERHERDREAAALIREAADFARWRDELEGSAWWDS